MKNLVAVLALFFLTYQIEKPRVKIPTNGYTNKSLAVDKPKIKVPTNGFINASVKMQLAFSINSQTLSA